VRELCTYNPEKAKHLMAEAGYPDGFKIDAYCTASEIDQTALLAAFLKPIGIDVDIKVRDSAVKAELEQSLPSLIQLSETRCIKS